MGFNLNLKLGVLLGEARSLADQVFEGSGVQRETRRIGSLVVLPQGEAEGITYFNGISTLPVGRFAVSKPPPGAELGLGTMSSDRTVFDLLGDRYPGA